MSLDNFYWLIGGYSSALTRLYYRAASFARHLFTPDMSVQDVAERKQVQEETDNIEQSLHACTEASHEVNKPRINILEGVSAAEDAHQVLISTNNDLFSARQVTAAVRARQWIGQMNDVSLQHLSQARGIDSAEDASIDNAIEPETKPAVNFVRYGAGYKLERSGV
jgi:hypothetical protein